MVQPGDRSCANLVDFIGDACNFEPSAGYRAGYSRMQRQSHTDMPSSPDSSVDTSPNVEVYNPTAPSADLRASLSAASLDATAAAQKSSLPAAPLEEPAAAQTSPPATQHATSQRASSPAAPLEVTAIAQTSPSAAPEHGAALRSSTPAAPLGTPQAITGQTHTVRKPAAKSAGVSEVVVDEVSVAICSELLCFIQNKIDEVPADVLIKICAEFYSSKEITKQKKILFETVIKTSVRYSRKRNSADDVRDIIKVFLQAEAKSMPQYVAVDLSNLPPLDLSNFDVMKLMKEIEAVKNSVKLITDSQTDIAGILGMVSQVKDDIANQVRDTLDGIKQSIVSGESDMKVNDPLRLEDDISKEVSCTNNDLVYEKEVYTVIDEAECSCLYSDVKILHEDNFYVIIDCDQGSDNQGGASETSVCEITADTYDTEFPPLPNHTKQELSKETDNPWQHQRKRSGRPLKQKGDGMASAQAPRSASEKVVIGVNSNTRIKAVQPRRNAPVSQENKVEKGLFLSRIRPKTTAREIYNLVQDETGISVQVEKLNTRYNTYSSFYIACDRSSVKHLLNKAVWPAGALIKIYEE